MIAYISSHFFFVRGYAKLDKYAKIIGFISIPSVLIFSGLRMGLISILIIWLSSVLGALFVRWTCKPGESPVLSPAISLAEEDVQEYLKTESGKYFIKRFPGQFDKFWDVVPHGDAFRFASLIKTENCDCLAQIPSKDVNMFLVSLSYVILIDQVMYTHFNDAYEKFRQRNNPPKMTTGWFNANPWTVFHRNVLRSRSIDELSLQKDFKKFTKFFVDYAATYAWYVNDNQLAEALLNDKDVVGGTYGRVLKKNIEAWKERKNQEWLAHLHNQAEAARKSGRHSL